MAQQTAGDFNIVAASTTGTQLAGILNRMNAALNSAHSGATAPTYLLNGMLWLDTTSSVTHILKYYNIATTAWISLLTVTTATGVVNLITATPVATTDATNKVYVDDADNLKLDIDGSVSMTGDLVIETAGANALMELRPGASGGGTGLSLYDDAGKLRGTVTMASATGLIGMSNRDASEVLQTSMYLTTDGNVNINGAAPTANTHLTRKDYVDDKFPTITGGTFTTTDGKTVTYNTSGLITSVV